MRTALVSLALLLSPSALAVPLQFSHQGRLLSADGAALEGSQSVIFAIYADATGTEALWTETQELTLTQGYFQARLGAVAALDSALFRDNDGLVLGITVGGAELPQRLPLVSVPYALIASEADTARGLAEGVTIDASLIVSDGSAVFTDGANIDFSRITGAPADQDSFAELEADCVGYLQNDGTGWVCEDLSLDALDATALTQGTVAIERLPVGTGDGQIAAGKHTHDALDVATGTLDVERLPVGTSATTVAKGDHKHDAADVISGTLAKERLPNSTAGAFTVNGLLTSTAGVVPGNSSATCGDATRGMIRWTGTALEVCALGGWTGIVGSGGLTESTAARSCKEVKAQNSSATSGAYWVDPDGNGPNAAFQAWCDMTTDGGGWTLVFHIFDPTGLKETEFNSAFGHNRWTDESWRFNGNNDTLTRSADGLVQPLVTQGMMDVDLFTGTWADLRMSCHRSNGQATAQHYAQVDGYATTNSNFKLLGARANGGSYNVTASKNSMNLTRIWHDNEPTSANGGHYLCDTTNTGTASAQFGFCYTDFLNNDNNLEMGDSIVSIAFGSDYGFPSGDWSPGFTMECGDMDAAGDQNVGTYTIWIR